MTQNTKTFVHNEIDDETYFKNNFPDSFEHPHYRVWLTHIEQFTNQTSSDVAANFKLQCLYNGITYNDEKIYEKLRSFCLNDLAIVPRK